MTDYSATDDAHRDLREALGAYVLGQLPPAEAEAVRAHLATCDECRAELAELQPVASALASMRRRPATGGPTPAALGSRIDSAIAGEAARRRRTTLVRSLTGLAAAAALVVVAVLGVRAFTGTEATAPVPTAVDVQVAPELDDVTATAGYVAHTWGLEVKLTTEGLDAGENFEAFVVAEDGAVVPAGTFVGVGENTMNCNLQSFVLLAEAAGFEIRDDQDQLVMSGDF
ncbi:MAG: zf-HC2 domain-containing protein [Geodermatophilaceae bacterium]|nr:zf-HC2 domain-containing protein [Geodermatophilaceae bacterium]